MDYEVVEKTTMKKSKRKSATGQIVTPKISLRVLVKALMAAGLISAMPTFAASLPTPCPGGACGTNTGNLAFLQAGTLKTPLPTTVGKVMTINQTSATAILNWQDFNIANGYTVNFVQPSSTSSTLNRIWDANPTTIAGSLNANGQIYLYNQNGIVFANGAQVNTGALIASSLDIKDSLYQEGYLTKVDGTYDFSGTSGFVRVDTGAVLNGSRIMLFAPVVENNGTIATPDGQTVLAAGNKVYLEASQDPNLRGVLVEVDVTNPGAFDQSLVGKVQTADNVSGRVTNGALGNVVAQRGNITLVGYAVNQQGLLSATTAVNENGTIKLEARYNVAAPSDSTNPNPVLAGNAGVGSAYDIRATDTGTVTLASGSAITIAPETSSTATVTASQGFNPSTVEVMGGTIDMQSNSSIVAPGGKVTLAAVSSGFDASAPLAGGYNVYQTITSTNVLSSFLNPNYVPLPQAGDTARVFLDSGSTIDVSGSTATVSVARNILAVQLRGAELADSPLQKTGSLYGQTVYVDIRQGTTFANYSGEEAQIQRGVAELTSSGGAVNLISTGDVVAKSGSVINISGGQVDYTGANVKTTSLISSNGVVYSIANASPNLIYTGIVGTYTVSSAKWGVTQTFNTMSGGDSRGRWDPGYVEGQAAGTLTVLSPSAVLDSSVVSKTVAGINQTQPYVSQTATSVPYMDTYTMLPQGGTLTIGDSAAVFSTTTANYNYVTNADVVFQSNALPADFSLNDTLPAAFQQNIYLDPSLLSAANSISHVGVYTNGTVTVNQGTSLTLAPGGSLTLQGDTINMEGSVYIPSGTVTLGAVETVASGSAPGGITVGSAGNTSTISTRGMWVNDSATMGASGSTDPTFINGGNVTINSGGNLTVAAGTVIDASGGAWVDSSNKIHGGNGGSISLTGNYNTNNNGTTYSGQLDTIVTSLQSYGVAGGKGGALSINAGGIDIGGTTSNSLNLGADFFSTGGFSSYTLISTGDSLSVAADTAVTAKSQTLILDNSALQMASGTDVYSFSSIGYLPDWLRNPVSITLKQVGKGTGSLTVGLGADIKVDPGAAINLTSDSQLTILGTLDAPAGTINLTLNSPLTSYNNASILLGSGSELLASGAVIMTPNAQGLSLGQVLSGGTINLNSNMFVVTQQGSVMDVSGAAANLDLPQLQSGMVVYRSSPVAGNAGSISITATEGALLGGSMRAGVLSGSTAAAGSFSLTLAGVIQSQRSSYTGFPQTPLWQIMVGPSGSFGTAVPVDGMAYVDPSALQSAGFDTVTLASGYGSIQLADKVALDTRQSVTLNAPVIDLAGSASITSDYVQLANTNTAQNQVVTQPSSGTGSLSVKANLVDITGDVSISGINQLSITSSGDIRLNGVLDTLNNTLAGQLTTQGNMTLQANQVYPTTMSNFELAVVDSSLNPAGTITILPGSGSSPVLSAGGEVTLSAASIIQDGVLKAPLGTINLGVTGTNSVTLGQGSLTSVSADGQIIPYGTMIGGTGWVYDLAWLAAGTPSASVTLTAPPSKQINVQGNKVAINSGATVDLSGGGDLYAYEFIPGTGGTVNVLNPTQGSANTYAIIPSLSGLSTFAPYDPQFSGQYATSASKSALGVGSSVYLSGGDGLSAGYYTLLPASYALLPGAYTVTLVSGHQDMLPSQAIQLSGGSEIMAGKLAVAGTNILASRWSGFEVASGSVARTESQFQDNYASSYFTSLAATNGTVVPYLPGDAGQLVVTANSGTTVATLALDGTILSQPGAGGLGAQVDLNVVGSGFDIVNTIGADNGLVQLTTDMLNNLGANSLLIGGVRSLTTPGLITVGANQVIVDNAGSVLAGPEIILAANDAVTVTAGSSIKGSGTFAGQANNITIGSTGGANGDGALLRVSTGSQVTVTRNNLSGSTTPTLTVDSGATLGGSLNSVLLDSSSTTNIGGGAVLSGSSFGVSAQNIAIGNPTSTQASTLLLSSALLDQLSGFSNLVLHSYNDIDFYGAVSLGGLNTSNQAYLIGSLTLDAKSINGINNVGGSNVIDASQVTLMNNNGAVVTQAQYGGGNLTINADNIMVAGGNMAIQGFDAVSLVASAEIKGLGTGGLTVQSGDATAHTLTVNAGQITAAANAKQSITASGYDISIESNTGIPVSVATPLGASLAISGNSINDAGIINMPTAAISLSATGTGSVTLASGAEIIAAGIAETIGGQTVYAPAGSVTLTAASGGITLDSGSTINVSANAGGGNAGSITLDATNLTSGQVSVSGTLLGSSSATGGSFTVDAGSLAGTDNSSLTALNTTLTSGGFSNLRDIRVRSGDLVIASGSGATANTFQLEADAGNIDVQGTINSSGTNGGNILLTARGNVTVESTALLDAHATGTLTYVTGTLSSATVAGGTTVMVGSTANLAVGESISGDGFPAGTTIASITNGTTFVTSAADTNANVAGVTLQVANSAGGNVTLETAAGAINLMTPTNTAVVQIDVHGAGNTGGTVLLRALQNPGGTDLAVNTLAGTSINTSSGANVSLEGFKVYNQNNLPTADVSGTDITINSGDVAASTTNLIYNDAQNFANYASTIETRLGISNDTNMNVVPGVEIDSAGNLKLAANWDLSKWRFNNEPGILTLRAAGDLTFGTVDPTTGATIATASLSDGFTSATSSTLKQGSSWSYRLVAGADPTAANVMAADNAVASGTGNVLLVAGTTVGTTIHMEQVRTGTGFIDIAAGGNLTLGNTDSVIYTAGVAAPGAPSYRYMGTQYGTQYSVFPVEGGDINISADGNINGAYANQLVSEWLWRQGYYEYAGYALAPAWWINYAAFQQSIGALGGGNVTISAGGDINNLSAVVPSSGYADSSGNTVVLGGGNLSVTAGGNINSGIFYVGNGQGTIQAGGALGAYTYSTSTTNPYSNLSINPDTILLLGQGGFNLQAVGDINLQAVLNPTMLDTSISQNPANSSRGYFYTYDGGGNISLTSLGGNINLVNSISGLVSNTPNTQGAVFLTSVDSPFSTTNFSVYPASFEATAFNGEINNSTSANILLFPSSTGSLQLFAATNINLGAGIGMSDMSPAALLPINSLGESYVAAVDAVSHGTYIDPVTQLPVPLHANDTQPITIVAGGDITTGDPSNLSGNQNNIAVMELPKQTLVSAGQNIINFSADIQNQQSTDTTSLVAGRDITFTTQEVAGITVSGPGQVVLQAGRNIDLGYSAGVVTEGNLNNSALPSQGANITVLAGAGQAGEDTQAFISKYIDPAAQGIYGADLIAFVSQYGASQNLTAEQAFTYFNDPSKISKTLQNAFVNQVFFDELRLSGRSAISSGNYSGGYTAISTLFPTGSYAGDLSLFNSQIKTEVGGNINILSPGGGVDAGLANVNTGKLASQIGVVTVGGGDINAFVNNNFTVNQSRVFTIQGGNILMWSSYGNIDAGNGSKTATSTPPPLLVVNPKTGEFSVDATGSIVGSGIRVLLGNANVVPGSVDLFAPTGTINAGDAGIGSAGNIFLGALQVIGANNINFGGTSAGVPVTAVAPVSVGGMGNVQDANKAADQATQNLNNASDLANLQAALANILPTFISVEVIGLGDESMGLQQ
jgi:filamentous hemagglutinin family protein